MICDGSAGHDVDVLVIGGGPAGSSLAARLARSGSLSVAVFEEQPFPREHIGESLASPAVPCLVEAGALDAVLDSGCAIRKFGGYYNWSGAGPAVSFFRHRDFERDGVLRWSMHVDRAQFDTVLLEHARRSGARVETGTAVEDVSLLPRGGSLVRLAGGRSLTCRFVVDASGRLNRTLAGNRRAWLSRYKNIALWTHVRGGRPAQSLDGDWNIFRAHDLSPIGCFAFEDGWAWYIPIARRTANGPVVQHSLGLVTDARALSKYGDRLLTTAGLIDIMRGVPMLRTLIADAEPVYARLNRAANYSMIRERLSDFDHGALAVGDAGFFVDPLFSSGVSFAMMQAGAAAALLEATVSGEYDEGEAGTLWDDYSATWRRAARTFAMGIDQWYAAIADANPDSVYWDERAEAPGPAGHGDTFGWLLDTDLQTDLMRVVTRGAGSLAGLSRRGALVAALEEVRAREPDAGARVMLKRDVRAEPSLTATDGGDRDRDRPSVWQHAEFWKRPMAEADNVRPLFGRPATCLRVRRVNGEARASEDDLVLLNPSKAQTDLIDRLGSEWVALDALQAELSGSAWQLALRLLAGGYLEIVPAESGRSSVVA